MSFFNQQTIPPPSSKPDEIKRSVNALNIRISNLERRPLTIGNSSYPLLQQMGDLPGVSNGTSIQNIIGKHFNINQFVNASNGAGGGTGTGTLTDANFVVGEVPAGTIDGTTGSDGNPTFTLAATPTANSVALYQNGLRQLEGAGNDYTISGSTITFLAPNIPLAGSNLIADYRKP